MEILFSFIETAPGLLKLLLNNSYIKEIFIQYLKNDFKRRFTVIIKEIIDIKNINNSLTLTEAISSNAFDGLIERTLSINNYTICAMDISVALAISLNMHLNESLDKDKVIGISFAIIDELKIETINNEKLKLLISYIGKDCATIINSFRDREEIAIIINDKKLLFNNYFSIFRSDHNDNITVYYPGNNKTWIDYEKENSLQVSVNISNIPKGFFLLGLDYKYNGMWLTEAINSQFANRTEYREQFNPNGGQKENIIWKL